MSTDVIHGSTGLIGLTLLGLGAGLAWGIGYALICLGGILLGTVVFARTRARDANDTD